MARRGEERQKALNYFLRTYATRGPDGFSEKEYREAPGEIRVSTALEKSQSMRKIGFWQEEPPRSHRPLGKKERRKAGGIQRSSVGEMIRIRGKSRSCNKRGRGKGRQFKGSKRKRREGERVPYGKEREWENTASNHLMFEYQHPFGSNS